MHRFFFFLFCYLVGAIPTSYLLVRVARHTDIRKHGSGNSGATNAARIMGIGAFFLILCIDALKAYGALYISCTQGSLSLEDLFICAGALLVGNSFSPFLGFSGGKGVATSLGIVSFFFPPWIVGAYASIFALTLACARRVDVASLIACSWGVGIVWYAGFSQMYIALAAGIGGFVWLRHWTNIRALLESRL